MKQIIEITDGDSVVYLIERAHCRVDTTPDIKEATRFYNAQSARDFIAGRNIGGGDFPGEPPKVEIIDDDDARFEV